MKYLILFVLLVSVGTFLCSLPKGGVRQLWKGWRPFLPAILFSLAAVLATILIAYFGGYLRVL